VNNGFLQLDLKHHQYQISMCNIINAMVSLYA